MNWKRILPAALIALVVIGVAVSIFADTTAEKKVGIAIHDLSDQAAKEYAELLYSRLTEEGYEVMIANGKNDQSLQNQQIKDWIKEKYAAVIISPVMISAASETVDIAKEGNLPVVFIGKEFPGDALSVYDRVAYVGTHAEQWGRLEKEAISQWQQGGDMNGDGSISYLLVQDDPENVQKQHSIWNIMQSLQDEDKALKEIKQITTGGSQSESNALCSQRIAEFGKDIEVIICDSDAGVLGAKQAIQDGGRAVGRDIYLISTAADTQQALKAVADGEISAVVHRDFRALNEKTVEVLQLLIHKKSPEKANFIDCVTVTSANVEPYIITE